ncbi:nitroreductase family protein [Novosphingobium sp. AAP1]|uniref:nitroreductase family protein n=1 Tax=Novosphingobium sp. AAP1 TaxID=1523413 RepID=UPI0006B92619|nr:nitroreductase family protein [Novosphingobium sp. AAP1]
MKKIVKSLLNPGSPAFEKVKHARDVAKKIFYAPVFRLQCYAYDFRIDRHHMNWKRSGSDYWRLSSELIFFYHKLEKGMCLPPTTRRFFGEAALDQTIALMHEWQAIGLDTNLPVYRATQSVLRAYRHNAVPLASQPAVHDRLVAKIDPLIMDGAGEEYVTPIRPPAIPDSAFASLKGLAQSRRSTRDFDITPVDFKIVEQAVEIAQLAPSACNRQPWHLHFYDKPDDIARMLKLQNGNTGFGQTIPLLALVTADLGAFFDSSERIEPALDGGLFLMSFLLALEAQGLASCCLNFCVGPKTDKMAHRIGNIPEQEKILTFLAIGHRRDGAITPLSPRRPISDVIRVH